MAGQDLEAWYGAEGPRVLRYLTGLCRDPVLAEELTQETFLQALISWRGYRGGGERAYLFGIARRVLAGHRRRERRRREAEARTTPPSDGPPSPFARGEDWLPQLAPDDVVLLLERALWQRPYADIAQELGRSENWARVRYFRLLARIRTDLEGGGEG